MTDFHSPTCGPSSKAVDDQSTSLSPSPPNSRVSGRVALGNSIQIERGPEKGCQKRKKTWKDCESDSASNVDAVVVIYKIIHFIFLINL